MTCVIETKEGSSEGEKNEPLNALDARKMET